MKTYIGDIHFSEDNELIMPGESRVVTVRFLYFPGIEQYITVGRVWYINEGGKNIGMGEMLEIIC